MPPGLPLICAEDSITFMRYDNSRPKPVPALVRVGKIVRCRVIG
jgi:hypothetical protein